MDRAATVFHTARVVDSDRRRGLHGPLFGVPAYGPWGVIPLFWTEPPHVDLLQLAAHRVVWRCLTFALVCGLRGQLGELGTALRDRRLVGRLAVTATMLATNWVIFIYAIASNQVVEASLGYFINPLVSVALGRIFLRERISRPQMAAVVLAALGVVALAFSMGGVPWLALVLAFSFGGYGLLRKTARANALPGSTVETLLMLPIGVGMLVYFEWTGAGAFHGEDVGWLIATGPVTALPLWWFANAARRLRLATLGFLQYLAPTGQFLLAVFLFHEPLAPERLVGFGFIWFALALYSADAFRRRGAVPTQSATTGR